MQAEVDDGRKGSVLEVFLAALRLGLTSFGGPIAHLGYFHNEYVVKRKWIDDQSYAEVVTFASSLPGATSSKVGIIVGTHRAGLLGGLAAWLAFTMPSALALIAFAYSIQYFDVTSAAWLNGLKIAAVVIVAQAVISMGTRLSPDRERMTITVGAAVAALALQQFSFGQVLVIVAAGLIGWTFLRDPGSVQIPKVAIAANIPRWLAVLSICLYFGLLLALPIVIAVSAANGHALGLFGAVYQSGALVFGGGHVVLPLLNAAVVTPGWLTSAQFLAGYGLTQAMPGPLFTFSAYIGTIEGPSPNGFEGGLIALAAIFLPSFLLVYGPLPFWDSLRRRASFRSVLLGINAAVVGILLAALYTPIFTSSVNSVGDFAILLVAGGMLFAWKRPPWQIVLTAAVVGLVLGLLGVPV